MQPLSPRSLLPSALALAFVACPAAINSGTLLPGEGEACTDDGCRDGLVCSHDAVCAEAGTIGTTAVGSDCSDTLECALGLECASDNTCAEADAEGTRGAGETCGSDDDCQAGFACQGKECVDLEIPFWEGGPCTPDDEDGEFRVLYQIPVLPTTETLDFFAMPFPNDLRLDASGHPDLDGFPSPGDTAPAVDLLIEALTQQSGWGIDPVVYFRFNRAHDLDSIKALTTDATVHFASIDPDADDYGELDAFTWTTRHSRGRYICPNWLAVSPYEGSPLTPNQTYAVWLTKGIVSDAGEEVFRDDDFPMLMQEDRPSDLTDARAYDTFGPFRDYVDSKGLTRGDIVAATVFSTGDPRSWIRYYREVVESEDTTVTLDEAADCSASPCDVACAGGSGFAEWHLKLTIPDFTGDAGAVSYASNYRPEVYETESLCAVLTVPDGNAPLAGWPTALWMGDVGGTSQAAIENGMASAMAKQGIATLALDLPHHGQRATGSDPLADWFDTAHPNAWRGNLLQAQADGHSLLRIVADNPDLGLDADNVWVVGEGAGAEAAVPMLAMNRMPPGAVLGNPGGHYGAIASERTQPWDVAHALQQSFADSNLGRSHPVVSLLQAWMSPVDPVTTAITLVREPEGSPKHLFVVQGVDDKELSIDATSAVLRAASIPTAGEVLVDFGQATIELPTFENVTTDDGRKTAASVQVVGGHHALSEDEAARAASFVSSGATEGSPTIRE